MIQATDKFVTRRFGREINRCIATVVILAHLCELIEKEDGELLDGLTKEQAEVMLKRSRKDGDAIYSRVRGNKRGNVPWSDLRLIVESSLREALQRVERSNNTTQP
jgi:hypothetical protein